MPEATVEYDTVSGRKSRHFKNAYAARRFYVEQDKLGKNPSVTCRSETMTTETSTATAEATEAQATPARVPKRKTSSKSKATASASPKKTSKKTAKKRVAKKSTKGTKKTTKKTTKTKEANQPKTKDGIRTSVLEKVQPTLQFLAKHPESNKKTIREGTGLKYLGIPWLEKNSYVKAEDLEENRGISYSITPEGKKFLDSLKK